ncbi:lipoprotein [Streptomyces sp. NBC_00178]|uniref:lipoprotein n=1 Tax=Streptomyces sp. NBC_00178 TaxID=2975672 RepID=UPI002E2B42B2|nr:lipoprotein [Streptomyces sp. NBC_00178]
MRDTMRTWIPAVLAATVLAGCSSPSDGGSHAGPGAGKNGDSAPARAAESAPAKKGGSLGGAGTACELPVTFDLAVDWKPQAVEVEPGSDLAALGQQGAATMVCEIDAKPAGNIGYLRVWQGKGASTTPRAALEDFVSGEENATGASYKETEAGAVPAVEVTYIVGAELLDERKTERAFAVATPKGPVVVHLGGLDSTEHREMLPAYELARSTLKLG